MDVSMYFVEMGRRPGDIPPEHGDYPENGLRVLKIPCQNQKRQRGEFQFRKENDSYILFSRLAANFQLE
jgi:hypothetical protein